MEMEAPAQAYNSFSSPSSLGDFSVDTLAYNPSIPFPLLFLEHAYEKQMDADFSSKETYFNEVN